MSEQETQSTMVDPSSRDIIFLEPDSILHSNIQQRNVQNHFDFTESDSSQLLLHEASEVTSAPDTREQEPLVLTEEDFLEMDDLIGPDPNLTNTDETLTNLQYEEIDGLGEFDLYHDTELFLNDMGPTDQATISQQYTNSLEQNMVNQFDNQLQANAAGAGVVNNQTYLGVEPSNNQVYPDSNNQLYSDGIDQFSNQFYQDGACQIHDRLWAHDHQGINDFNSSGINDFTSEELNYVSLSDPSSGTCIFVPIHHHIAF